MITIDDYRTAVEFLAKHKLNFDIKNKGDDYAEIILTNIFVNSTKTIRIAANDLRNKVVDSPEYQDALCSFLSKEGTTLKIIVAHLPDSFNEISNNNIYRRLRLHPAFEEGRISIRIAGKDRFFLNDRPINFCVADGTMYRIENDIDKRTAICNFGNQDKAIELESIFDRAFSTINDDFDLKKVFK